MNIFVLHSDPEIAARMHCAKHLIKMILEVAQMLATTQRHFGMSPTYKSTHFNHPCTVWTRTSKSNYDWLYQHGLALCDEYTQRYKKVHKTEQYFHYEFINIPDSIPDIGLTPFAQAMPDQYKNENAVIAYRQYYLGEKKAFATWKNAEVPLWFELNDPSVDL